MKLSASEAAKQTGKSIPTITRAIKSGKISAEKTAAGGYLIEASELFRVFRPITKTNEEHMESSGSDPQMSPSVLQDKVRNLEAALADAKTERDEWRDQAKRLAMALPAPEAEASRRPTAGFWGRLIGKT